MSDPAPPAPAFPTETELYILPDGRVVVADLPAELVALAAALGPVEPCDPIDPHPEEGAPDYDQTALSHN